jgi:hypothetical protein
VAYGAQGAGEALVEVHCFYSEHYVITVRQQPCEVLDQPTFLVLGIGSEVVVAAALFTLFRRRGWF